MEQGTDAPDMPHEAPHQPDITTRMADILLVRAPLPKKQKIREEDYGHMDQYINTISDEFYKKYTVKGIVLRYSHEEQASSRHDEPSKFDSHLQLVGRWGWTDETSKEGGVRFVQYSPLNGIRDLVKYEQGIRARWEHTRGSIEGMSKYSQFRYPPTFAQYENVFWPSLGIIMAVHNESPGYMVMYPITSRAPWTSKKPAHPELRHWSDVVYLNWMHQTAKVDADPANLRFVIHRRIRNGETLCVLAYVLKQQGDGDEASVRASTWPNARAIRRCDRGFAAMLYTQCVRGTVKLLTQHRSVFGKRRICEITAYEEESSPSYEPTLVIEIEVDDGT